MFFQTPNTWATPIPDNHPVQPISDSVVQFLRGTSGSVDISCREWSVPVFYADNNTRTYDISLAGTGALATKVITENGRNRGVPIPDHARPAGFGKSGWMGNYDSHMVVIRGDECWDFVFMNGTFPGGPFETYHVKRWDLRGEGLDSPSTWGNCRAAPVPLLHTIITFEEMQAGVIPHSLGMATHRSSTQPGIWPCENSSHAYNSEPEAPRYGYRFRIKNGVDLGQLGLSAAGLVVAKAIQAYGMMLIEGTGAGGHVIYAENVDYDAGRDWGSIWDGHGLGSILEHLELVEPVRSFSTIPPVVEPPTEPPPVEEPPVEEPPVVIPPEEPPISTQEPDVVITLNPAGKMKKVVIRRRKGDTGENLFVTVDQSTSVRIE